MKIDTTSDVVVAAPPTGAVVTHAVLGVSLADWVLWLNLFYIILAVGWRLWSIYKESRNGSK